MNSSVFSWRRNAKYVDDVLTDEGNAFQARAAAAGKARSSRVARRVDGTHRMVKNGLELYKLSQRVRGRTPDRKRGVFSGRNVHLHGDNRFYRASMPTRVINIATLSVCLSVCPSATLR